SAMVYQWHEFAGRWEDFTKEQFDEVQSSGEIVLGETIITPAMTRKLYTTPPAASVDVQTIALIADMAAYIRAEGGENAGALLSHADKLIDSAGGAKGITGSVSPQMRDAIACTPQPAEGDGAVLAEAARYHYSQADIPRDQFGNTSKHKNPKLEAWHRQIGDAITALTRPAATAVVPRPSDDELWDQTLRERDDAEKSLGDMFQAVTGRSAEWSSAWHYKD